LVEQIIACGKQKQKKTLIINCNVNPGYSNEIQERLSEYNYKVSYNPEWVAQGTIIRDQILPDLVVIGEADKEEGELISSIYKKLCQNNPPIHRMDRLSAEITKVSLNCYLTTKITYANMIGDLALKTGADPDKILAAVGDDSRVGNKYFRHGFGYGGPCFPRDTKALIHYCNSNKIKPLLCEATEEYNTQHLRYQVDRFMQDNQKGKAITFNAVTYKPGVPIIEESQQLQFAVLLAKNGYEIVINDFASVCDEVKEIYGDLFRYEPV
jgi:nucleotide sugar dehydrogenase